MMPEFCKTGFQQPGDETEAHVRAGVRTKSETENRLDGSSGIVDDTVSANHPTRIRHRLEVTLFPHASK